MNKTIPTLLFIPSLLAVGNVFAADDAAKKLWKVSAEVGYVATSGNTETDTLNLKANADTDREKWHHKFEMTILDSSTDNVATAEKYVLMGQSDYKISKPNFLFGVVTYEEDKFSTYDYQMTEAFGYGRRVIEDDDLTLDLEIGPGARQSKDATTGASSSETIARAAAKLDWVLSKTSSFNEVLTIEAGEDSTITKSVTSLSTQVNGSLQMKLTYTYKNTSDLPVTVEDTDTETAVTLVYNF